MLLHKRGSKFRACTHSRNQLDTEPALVAPVVGKGELNQLAALVIADGLEIVNRRPRFKPRTAASSGRRPGPRRYG